jgi:hypothetical protein
MDRDAGPAHPEAPRPGTTERGGFTMPKFLMLARSDARAWEGVSAEEGQRIVKQYVDWSDRMRAAGRLAGSNKLQDGDGRVLAGNGSQIEVKDGPYSETKEVVGGYWLLEAADFDEAVKLAKDSPHLRFGTLEIRAIEEM